MTAEVKSVKRTTREGDEIGTEFAAGSAAELIEHTRQHGRFLMRSDERSKQVYGELTTNVTAPFMEWVFKHRRENPDMMMHVLQDFILSISVTALGNCVDMNRAPDLLPQFMTELFERSSELHASSKGGVQPGGQA